MEKNLYIYHSMNNGDFNLEICPILEETKEYYHIINIHGVKIRIYKSSIERANTLGSSEYYALERKDEEAIKSIYKALEHDRFVFLKEYYEKMKLICDTLDKREQNLNIESLKEIKAPKTFTRINPVVNM